MRKAFWVSRYFGGLAFCCLLATGSLRAQDVVTVQEGDALTDQYCMGLIQLALAQAGGGYKFEVTADNDSTFARRVEQLNDGTLSVIWSGTTIELEDTLRPIRIPLLKGLMGHRLLMIRQGEQHRFDTIQSAEDLKRISLGQGTDWADTRILDANGLQVVKNPKYLGLFHMLAGERFDAFPRGVHEIWSEVDRQRIENGYKLAVEQRLMLVYRMPMYLFVSKDNVKLANHLEKGLLKALDNGAFNTYFFTNPGVKELLEKADLKNRKVIELVNPDMPPKTPLQNKALWLDIDSL